MLLAFLALLGAAPGNAVTMVAALKAIPFFAAVLGTNPGFIGRLILMIRNREWLGILQWWGEWILSLAALAVIVAAPFSTYKMIWCVLFAASAATNWFFYRTNRSHLTVLDVMTASYERAASSAFIRHYLWQFTSAGLVFAFCVMLFAVPAVADPDWQAWAVSLWWLPLLSVALVIGEFWLQGGRTLSPMPSHVSAISAALLATFLLHTSKLGARRAVSWQPQANAKKQSIVMLVDESIRGDYISLKPGNALTPKLAALAKEQGFINFGPAVSGGNNSGNANAILRFGANIENLADSATFNPSLFAYAKKAGFRTIYINAQTSLLRNGNDLMNFMTAYEKLDIDAFYVTKDLIKSDYELADIVALELRSGQPVFIYGNKNGAHFPYEWNYPKDEKKPWVSRKAEIPHAIAPLLETYRKAIAWNVDGFMPYFFQRADLSNATVIYTSDHGQQFKSSKFPHGQITNPDPRTGLVPLLVHTRHKALRQAFTQGARRSTGRASHFQIAPCLYQLMGYAPEDIAKAYPESLFTGSKAMPRMVTGDIFGILRSSQPVVTTIDPSLDYFERSHQPIFHGQGKDQVLTFV
ncbi:sulfatase-like hydrolase/transferase [Aestuariivirga litoralis]|uniref:sulfatase-like hydrolase/transferase n=1 Tax=Aestuariivirga litoralis TaxID=2650924 RepID=UPI0018C68330|nr:sulfatase-like hydrolase/transferase [Aestuariivirga litoralis]MBG1232047.1 sulfatase-like hydrolase/transferase [Aestuariivirga litoralis]